MKQYQQGSLADALFKEILGAIHAYDESLYLATVLGVLELVKQELINDAQEDME